MTAPYTQQNYADWKARFQQTSAVGGLLRQAKQVAGIEDEPQPLLTPPFNPNVEQAPQQDPADLHEHKRGLLGGLRHLVGADRTAPEVAALLTPDQQKRARPGLLSTVFNAVVAGKGPQTVQQERARQMLDLGDQKQARDMTAQQEATARRIEAVAATMSPQDGAEYAARMKGIYGLPTAQAAISAAVGLKEREFAPQAPRAPITKNTEDGIMQYNLATNQWEPMRDAEGRPMMAPPSTGSFATPSGLTGPNGRPMVMNNQTGRMEEAPEGVTRETAATGRSGFGVPAMRKQSVELQAIIDNAEAAIAEAKRYPQAFGLTRASETLNPRIDPKGNEARRLFGRVASITRHETFGAALTPTEAATARSWVGRTMDPADKIVGDLENLLRWAKAKKADLDGEVQTLDRPAAPRAGAPAPAAGGKTITVNGKTFIIP